MTRWLWCNKKQYNHHFNSPLFFRLAHTRPICTMLCSFMRWDWRKSWKTAKTLTMEGSCCRDWRTETLNLTVGNSSCVDLVSKLWNPVWCSDCSLLQGPLDWSTLMRRGREIWTIPSMTCNTQERSLNLCLCSILTVTAKMSGNKHLIQHRHERLTSSNTAFSWLSCEFLISGQRLCLLQ